MFTSKIRLAIGLSALLILPFSLTADEGTDQKASPPSAPEIHSLIQQLGDPEYKVREAASEKLMTIGPPAVLHLKKAIENDDPEISWRAKKLLAKILKKNTKPSKKSARKPVAATGRRATPNMDPNRLLDMQNPEEIEKFMQQQLQRLFRDYKPGQGQSMPRGNQAFTFRFGGGQQSRSWNEGDTRYTFTKHQDGRITGEVVRPGDQGPVRESFEFSGEEEFKQKDMELFKKYNQSSGLRIFTAPFNNPDNPSNKALREFVEEMRKRLGSQGKERFEQLQKNLQEKMMEGLDRPKTVEPQTHTPDQVQDRKDTALGFIGHKAEPVLQVQLGLKKDQGILLTEVITDSPAHRAGLQKWDLICTISGTPVTSIKQIRVAYEAIESGQTVELGIIRKSEKITIGLTR
ncbi:MAG: PDZ domain-containing protein [Planctomycetota bacterium]|nr:PDZ domain-containing protein [Planctomycetota bacterium]